MLPLVLCMCVSTVWGRYHYVADIFGGIVTGTLGYVIGRWIMKRREEAYGQEWKTGPGRFALVRQ
jgi:membrane-associated phospholipid phosphatase